MASNIIPRTYAKVVSLAEDAADGATTLGTAVGLAQNTAVKIRADLVALTGNATATPPTVGAQNLYDTAKAAKTAAAAAERAAEKAARTLVAGAVDVLKHYLGRQWSGAWAAAGFTEGSLAVPDDPLPVLGKLRAYFAGHATQENAGLGVTAATLTAQATALSDARSANNNAATALKTAKDNRDAAQAAVIKRLSGLLSELGELLADDDPRWDAFGFERPADGEQPGAVETLTVTAGGAGSVYADWGDARRAERYRVWRQIVGVDPEPVIVELTPHDSEVTLTGLPSGKDVMVSVAGVNAAGEGPACTSAAARIP